MPPATAAATSTPWLAPEVRVMLLDPANGSELQPLAGFVISVQVEQVSTGVGSATVVLHNERYVEGGAVPSWRFNGLRWIGPGAQLRVDARYVGGAWFEGNSASV